MIILWSWDNRMKKGRSDHGCFQLTYNTLCYNYAFLQYEFWGRVIWTYSQWTAEQCWNYIFHNHQIWYMFPRFQLRLMWHLLINTFLIILVTLNCDSLIFLGWVRSFPLSCKKWHVTPSQPGARYTGTRCWCSSLWMWTLCVFLYICVCVCVCVCLSVSEWSYWSQRWCPVLSCSMCWCGGLWSPWQRTRTACWASDPSPCGSGWWCWPSGERQAKAHTHIRIHWTLMKSQGSQKHFVDTF